MHRSIIAAAVLLIAAGFAPSAKAEFNVGAQQDKNMCFKSAAGFKEMGWGAWVPCENGAVAAAPAAAVHATTTRRHRPKHS